MIPLPRATASEEDVINKVKAATLLEIQAGKHALSENNFAAFVFSQVQNIGFRLMALS